MNAAAQLLIGEKDFSSFAKIHTDVKNHICNVSYAKWKAKGKEISFEISANRFLRNMVGSTLLKTYIHRLLKEFEF